MRVHTWSFLGAKNTWVLYLLESTEGLAVEQASVVPLEFGADVVVAGIQLVLPLDCLLPVWMTFSTGFLNKCVLHS